MARFGSISVVILLVGMASGWLLGAVVPGLAQVATPVAEVDERGPALLGGDLPGDPEIQLVKVASGLNDPVNLAFPPDGSGRIFVVERQGPIRIVDADGTVRKEPFLDLSKQVAVQGSQEQGALGLAFHPDYATNGRFFVDYNSVTANNDVFVTEFHVSQDDPNRADPDSERVLLHIAKPFNTHSGGTIRFDAEGQLFIAVGDGGEYGDPFDNAQNRFSLLGSCCGSTSMAVGRDSRTGYRLTTRSPGATGMTIPSLDRYRTPTTKPAAQEGDPLVKFGHRIGSSSRLCLRRSGHLACGIPGRLPSTRRREMSTSVTSALLPGRRSTSGPRAPLPAKTMGGTGSRARTASPRS